MRRTDHRARAAIGTASKLAVSALLLALGCSAAGAQDAGTPALAALAPAAASAPVAASGETYAREGAAGAPGLQAEAVLPDACFEHPAKLSSADIDEFLAAPDAILSRYDVGLALSNRVRSLAGSDRRTLDPLIRLAAAAKPEQKALIGAGLGRAAFACSRVAPAYAALIQTMMAGADSPELLTAFLSATNDIQTAALGAGGGGGGGAGAGGGLSGGGLAGPGSAGLGGDEVVPTTAQSFSLAGSGSFVTSNDDSVSPANND